MDACMQEAEPINSEFNQLQYGSYRVLNSVGAGGMSSVYRAVHVDTGHEVAWKVLPVANGQESDRVPEVPAEARSAESLEHPNIVSIFDRGVDQGRHYLALEYVQGCDLHEYVQMRGPLSASEGIRVIRQVAEGMRFASARGLIHRDIKPSNILRSKSGEIKITDLGLALHTEFEDERVTARARRSGRLTTWPRSRHETAGQPSAERSLLAGMHLLLPAYRHSALPRGRPHRQADTACQLAAAECSRPPPGRARGPGPGYAPDDGQAHGGPLCLLRRFDRGSGQGSGA